MMWYNNMFGFIKTVFFIGLTVLSSLTGAASQNYISLNNQECKVRPEIVNVNSNDPVFYPFGIKTSKCSGCCNNINNPYTKLCVPDIVQNLNVKVFNLMPRTNETRHLKRHKTCKCKCRLYTIVCNIHVMLVNILFIQIVNAAKKQLINQQKNVLKILKKQVWLKLI